MDTNKKAKVAGVSMVEAWKLRPHPKNPRKDLGDLSELRDSIEQNGIMQNLTAVPDPDNPDSYIIIIGHRRYAAGKEAGLEEFPVMIRDIDEATQVRLMLCENIQRNDLTVIEQAEGFQMMMDYGITVEELAKDTGFAPSTIYHRLNIAKLDKSKLESKMPMLTITDLIELEKIEDVKVRNELIEEYDGTHSFRLEVDEAYDSQERNKRADEIEAYLVSKGLVKKEAQSWDSKVGDKFHLHINPDTKPKSIKIKDKGNDLKFFWIRRWERSASVLVWSPAEKAKSKKKTKEEVAKEGIVRRMNELYEEIDIKASELANDIRLFKKDALRNEKKLDREVVDAFVSEVFLYMAAMKPLMSECAQFASRSLGLKESWEYENDDEYGADIISKLKENTPMTPLTWALEIVAGLSSSILEGKKITQPRRPYYWSEGRILFRDRTYRVELLLSALRFIGFEADEDQKKLLRGEGKPFTEIAQLIEEYKKLTEVV